MNKPYFLSLQYFATGEGMTHTTSLVIAKNESVAIRKFLKQNMLKYSKGEDFKRGMEYFKHGIDIYDMTTREHDSKIRQILIKYLQSSVIDTILQAESQSALFEFNFHFYINYS